MDKETSISKHLAYGAGIVIGLGVAAEGIAFAGSSLLRDLTNFEFPKQIVLTGDLKSDLAIEAALFVGGLLTTAIFARRLEGSLYQSTWEVD